MHAALVKYVRVDHHTNAFQELPAGCLPLLIMVGNLEEGVPQPQLYE